MIKRLHPWPNLCLRHFGFCPGGTMPCGMQAHLVFSSVTKTFKGRSTKGCLCHLLPGLTGITPCAPPSPYPCSQWVSGMVGGDSQKSPTQPSLLLCAVTHQSACRLRKGDLRVLQIWGPQRNGDICKLCTDHMVKIAARYWLVAS